MSEDFNIDQIIDRHGEVRRMGSLVKSNAFVSAHSSFESAYAVYDDAMIKRLITDTNRRTSRAFFDDSWILNQGQYGSCNGQALAEALARARVLRGLPKLLLSGAYAYSKMNGGRDNGSALEDGLKVVQQYGCAPLDLVPQNQIYPNLQPKNADQEAAKHKGLSAFAVETKQGLRSALAAGFPCIVAVHVGNRFDTLKGGICGLDNGSGNHAVCVDDLKIINGTEVYDMANSWGLSFGDKGRGYLVWDHFAGTFNNHMFYAIASTEEAGE